VFGRNNKLDVQWLASVEFFRGFDEELLTRIAHLGERVEIEAGTELIDQGRVGDACYVIVEGSATVIAGGQFIATVGPGSMVGEMALVSHRPRNATVRAETPMVVVAFAADKFRDLLHTSPEVAHRVLSLLDERAAD
jgi:CRP/FNR family transcriptional regulator, cyclic AMP receptor protein